MFGGNTANIKAVITADDKASGTLKKFGSNVEGMSAKLKSGLVAAGVAAVAFGVTSVKAFTESEDAVTQLNAVIKSTHGIAGVTADSAIKLSKSLQAVTKFSDESILSSETLLLTFKAIGSDIFPHASEMALNMATRFNMDLKQASISLGKALQDPIRGVAQLRRQGIDFSKDQQEVIRKLVETNQLGKAQAMVMKEIDIQTGNAARAAGTTFSGKLEILKNRFNDMQEVVGQFIVNGLMGLFNMFSRVSAGIGGVTAIINKFFGPSLKALFLTVQTQLLPSLMKLWNALQPGLTTALTILGKIVGVIVIASLWAFINAINVAVKINSILISILSQLAKWFFNAAGAGINAAKAIGSQFDWLVGIIRAVANAIRDVINLAGRATGAVSKLNPINAGKSLLSHLPHFADGGVVPGAVGQPTLAVVHGGETVIPTKGGSMGNVSITIQAGAFMGSQIEARKFAKMVMDSYADLAASKNKSTKQMMGA